MRHDHHYRHAGHSKGRHSQPCLPRAPSWVTPWVFIGTIVSGTLALFWLLLRTGSKPSRFAYPCQQAALSTAALAFGVPFVAMVVAARGQLLSLLRTARGLAMAAGFTALVTVGFMVAAPSTAYRGVLVQPPAGYRPEVFLVDGARGPVAGRFGGVDDLVTLMGTNGKKFYRSTETRLTSGPDGLIDADDVVLLKINGQWPERGGTNTDVLRGVMRQIVEHPDGFTGEIVVADNGQGWADLNRTRNNAEDITQSPQDVVNDFVGEGWRVSALLWDSLRNSSVGEYSAGDMNSGYVVANRNDTESGIKTSYPKFQTALGTYISFKHGVWSPGSASFDPSRLVVINMPVLKTHSIYGVTGAVKNHMGVVTRELGTDSHNGVARGGMGTILADVRCPDLTILDAIWVLARPGLGPNANYADATRRDQLVASTDPVALDIWSVKNILIPTILENGYSYGDYHSKQDPDDPASVFRTYLDRSMNEMLLGGIDTTNDLAAIDLRVFAVAPIPAVSSWGVIIMSLMFVSTATILMRSRGAFGRSLESPA